MTNFVSKDKINNGRQFEVDLLRGFTALIIIICHVGLYLGNHNDVALYCFSDILGSEWGAPVFMFLMGMCVIYSKHQDPKSMFRRGIILFVLGYILSFFRTILPLFIFGNIDEWTQIASFFVVDILQFAGLTFMLFALLKKLKMPSWCILLLSIIMVGIGQIMMTFVCPTISDGLASYFINLFFPITEWSCFPLFTWFFFPAFGLCFGEILIRCKNKNKLYGILLPISFCGVLFVYLQFHFLYPNYTNYYFGGNFYYMGLKNVILTAFFICFALSFWYFCEKILPQFIKRYLTFLSNNLFSFYIISWIIISMLIHLQAYFCLVFDITSILALMIIVSIICSIATQSIVILKKFTKKSKNAK